MIIFISWHIIKIIKDGYGLAIVDTSYVKLMDTDLFQEPSQNRLIMAAIWFDPAFSLAHLDGLGANTMGEHLGIEWTEVGPDYIKARMPVDHRTSVALLWTPSS